MLQGRSFRETWQRREKGAVWITFWSKKVTQRVCLIKIKDIYGEASKDIDAIDHYFHVYNHYEFI